MKAKYVSVWDGGRRIATDCEYNPETKEVDEVVVVDPDELGEGVEILDEEYIELPDGTVVRDFWVDGYEHKTVNS